ncbi:MAG: DUF393 domain-containing protein [Planctomycetes bacterium]|nr:DUF393 domain-containing protein [Planctomycetota bacterium]
MERPVLLFDGGCAFCRRWAERIRPTLGESVDVVPIGQAPDLPISLSEEKLLEEIHLVLPTGDVARGFHAIARARWESGRPWWLRMYRLPGVGFLAEMVYRRVARSRTRCE